MIELIREKFRTWNGFELHSISYGGDDQGTDEKVAWLNSLAGDGKKNYAQCVLFLLFRWACVNGGYVSGWTYMLMINDTIIGVPFTEIILWLTC